MDWNVDIGPKAHRVDLPEVISDNTEFDVLLNGRRVKAKWQHHTKTLFVLDPKFGDVWTSIHTRSRSVAKYPGESESNVSMEFTPAGSKATLCVEATVGIFIQESAHHDGAKIKKPLVVRSQITGKVLKVLVKPADKVSIGDTLIVIEAMKMENRIIASENGVIDVVSVKEGSTVSTGSELVKFK